MLKLVVDNNKEGLKAFNAGRAYCILHGPYLAPEEILRGAALYAGSRDESDALIKFCNGFAEQAKRN